MSRIVACAAFAFGSTIVLSVLLWSIAPSDRWRWMRPSGDYSRLGWVFRRIHDSERPIDVVFLGSSHTCCAVSDEAIEKRLSELGIDVNVVNFGIPHLGRNLELHIMREVLKRHKPSLFMIEARENEPRKGHPIAHYVYSTDDAIASFHIMNLEWASDMLHLARRNLIRCADVALGRDDTGKIPTPAVSRWSPAGGDGKPLTEAEFERYQRSKKRTSLGPASLEELEFAYPASLVRKQTALGNEHGAMVRYLYLPGISGVENRKVVGFPKELSGQVVYMGWGKLLDHRYWFDYVHINSSGTRLIAPLLAERIAETLGAAGSSSSAEPK